MVRSSEVAARRGLRDAVPGNCVPVYSDSRYFGPREGWTNERLHQVIPRQQHVKANSDAGDHSGDGRARGVGQARCDHDIHHMHPFDRHQKAFLTPSTRAVPFSKAAEETPTRSALVRIMSDG